MHNFVIDVPVGRLVADLPGEEVFEGFGGLEGLFDDDFTFDSDDDTDGTGHCKVRLRCAVRRLLHPKWLYTVPRFQVPVVTATCDGDNRHGSKHTMPLIARSEPDTITHSLSMNIHPPPPQHSAGIARSEECLPLSSFHRSCTCCRAYGPQ